MRERIAKKCLETLYLDVVIPRESVTHSLLTFTNLAVVKLFNNPLVPTTYKIAILIFFFLRENPRFLYENFKFGSEIIFKK